MDKQTLVRDMKQFVKNESRARNKENKEPPSFITQAAVRRYWGRSKEKVRDLLAGLSYEDSGRDHKYFIPDVAERIMDRMKPGA